MNRRDGVEASRRVRVERGVYRQPNGKYAVCFMLDGRPRFRTVEGDLDAARSARARLAIAAQAGLLPAYTGMRISELLALNWADVDFGAGVIHVRAQLSRAHHGVPARRVPPKTAAAIRDIPLVAQLSALLRDQRQTARFAGSRDHVFATGNGTPLGHRNVESRALQRAAAAAGLEAVRFHDLRHTFASHLIIDLRLDVTQVSRILGHASVTTTLNIYTHLFDDTRHATEIRTRMAASPFARLLEPDVREADNVVAIARWPKRTSTRRRRGAESSRT